MPKTKLESVVFTALMVFCMVFSMTCYTGVLRAGGVTYGLFAQSIREMWIEFAFVFLLVFFGVSRIAPRIALKLLHPRELPQILFTLVVQQFQCDAWRNEMCLRDRHKTHPSDILSRGTHKTHTAVSAAKTVSKKERDRSWNKNSKNAIVHGRRST